MLWGFLLPPLLLLLLLLLMLLLLLLLLWMLLLEVSTMTILSELLTPGFGTEFDLEEPELDFLG